LREAGLAGQGEGRMDLLVFFVKGADEVGGGLLSTARLGYRTAARTATRAKFIRQEAVKFSLDSARTPTARPRARKQFFCAPRHTTRPRDLTTRRRVLESRS